MTRARTHWLLAAGLLLHVLAAWPVHAQDDGLDDLEGDEEELDQTEEDADGALEGGADDVDWAADADDEAAEGSADLRADEDDDADGALAAMPDKEVSLTLTGGLGMGMRSIEIPTQGMLQHTRTGLFPAFGVDVAVDYHVSAAFDLGLHASYESAFPGQRIIEQHVDGSERPMDLRTHRLEGGLAPTIYLDDDRGWSLGALLGYTSVGLRPEAHHLVTPSYSLAGPQARVELGIPLLEDMLRLRLGPELHGVLVVGSQLRDRGVDMQGLGLGGEASIELRVTSHLAVQGVYHEVHVSIASNEGDSFSDVSRFALARLSGAM